MFQITAASPLVEIYSSSKWVGNLKICRENWKFVIRNTLLFVQGQLGKKPQTKNSCVCVSWNINSCSYTYAYLLALLLAGLMVELLVFLMASQLASVMGPLWALLKASLEIHTQKNEHICGFINGPTPIVKHRAKFLETKKICK